MKKYVVTASLAAGLSMISGAAFAQTTGTVGAGYSRVDPGSIDYDSYGVNGSVTIPMSGGLAIQLDGTFTDSNDTDVQITTGTAHLLSRSDSQTWGGYVGLADVDSTSVYAVGGEYAKFFAGSTLALNAGYANIDDFDSDLFGLNAEYRIFANDNLRFDLGLGVTRVEGPGGDTDVTTAGVGVEYRFTGTPISVGGSYKRADTDGGDADIFGVSLKWDFGNGSLKGRDRTGQTFGPLGGFDSILSIF